MSSDQPKPVQEPRGQPLAVDRNAVSARPGEPAFVARPEGAPVYYGFQVLDDVTVDGFVLGKITDFEAEPCEYGDAFVIAPDNSRCGLVWEIGETPCFRAIIQPEPGRWGVWDVSFPFPMTSRENARRNLESILPKLQQEWNTWRRRLEPE